MKKFVIGDIHGSNKALLQVLERSGFDKESDLLISLGDIADGWNEVPECVDTLLSIKNLIAIRGNHDVWCYDWFEMGATPLIWTQQGGKATLDAYVRTGKMTEDSHKAFWKNQVDWYIDDENRLFIHAGWDYTLTPIELNVSIFIASLAKCYISFKSLFADEELITLSNSFKLLDSDFNSSEGTIGMLSTPRFSSASITYFTVRRLTSRAG